MKNTKAVEELIQSISLLIEEIVQKDASKNLKPVSQLVRSVSAGARKYGEEFKSSYLWLVDFTGAACAGNKSMELIKQLTDAPIGEQITIGATRKWAKLAVYGKIEETDFIARRLPFNREWLPLGLEWDAHSDGIFFTKVEIGKKSAWDKLGFCDAEKLPYYRSNSFSSLEVIIDVPEHSYLIAESIEKYARFCLDKRKNPNAKVTFDQLSLF
jgi:hypothetical protein